MSKSSFAKKDMYITTIHEVILKCNSKKIMRFLFPACESARHEDYISSVLNIMRNMNPNIEATIEDPINLSCSYQLAELKKHSWDWILGSRIYMPKNTSSRDWQKRASVIFNLLCIL